VEPLEQRLHLAAQLVISEFLASNATGLQDGAGNRDDWIEIHNAGDAPANLNDYFLTDKASTPEEWRFPAQSLAAGAYLVIFADSTAAPPVANTELHTNFSLSKSGEYLGLINAADDSVAFDYSPMFPSQSDDVSYGLSDANNPSSTKVYFSIPTPGAANNPSAAVPTFSVQGKVFTGTLSVSLSDATPGSVIHYTTDNSAPTASSPIYTGPISLTQSTPIRAMATASGLASSPVVSQTYERVDSTVTSVQNANLPIILINTYGATLNDTDSIGGSATVMNSVGGTTDLLNGVADYQGRIGIHIRGSTSESYPKQQYSMELWNESNDDKKASLLGMPSQSDWVLYDPFTETTLMQNPLAYKWANETGHYASRTQFVELYMSTANNTHAGNTTTLNYSSNYMGVYILEEKVKIDNNRVDIDNPISATNPNGGFVVQQDRYTGTNFFVTPQGVHMVLQDPDDATLTTPVANAWNAFENALFSSGSDWKTPGAANYYGNYIDINSFADYYLLNEMTRNIDAFWLSTFYTKQADTVVNGTVTQRGLISAGPVWDFNLSLGAANYNFSADSDGWDTNTLTPYPGAPGVSGFNPQDAYFQRLLADPNFVQAVSDRWNQLRAGAFSTTKLMADIDANVSLLSDNTGVYPVGANPTGTTSPLMRNFQKWQILGVYQTTQGMFDPDGSWIQDVNLMKNWLTARVNWMDSQFIPAPVLTPGGNYGSSVPVTMTPRGPSTTSDTVLIPSNATYRYVAATSSSALNGWYLPGYTYSTTPAWGTGNGGFGYDNTPSNSNGNVDFTPFITTNVHDAMFNHATSLYLRTTFTLADPSSIQALIFQARYDDGFVLWINGVRVMDANSPENRNPTSATAAAGSGDDSAAITYRSFNVTSVKSLLVAGTNTIAIQVLNSGSGSADLLMQSQLLARTYSNPTAGSVYYTTDGSDPRTTTGGISPSAILYTGSFNINSTTEILARTLVGGAWSALADQVYNLTPDTLRIIELMYAPASDPNKLYEFIKLQNIGSTTLDLSNYAFTSGVTFTFPAGTMLAAGASGVVVQNHDGFLARYGSQFNLLGTYSGSLDNSGEKLTLDDAFGNHILSFTYDPTWYPETKGGGYSLVIRDPAGDKANWGLASGWNSSLADSPLQPTTLVAGGGVTFSVNISFAQNISNQVDLSNLSLTNSTTGATIDPSTAHSSVSGNTLTITFTAPPNGALHDGNYTGALPATAVKTLSGVPMLSSDALSFYVLAGDANQSRSVEIQDFNQLAANFGKTGKTFAEGNFDYSADGKVTIQDFNLLAANFGKHLDAPTGFASFSQPARAARFVMSGDRSAVQDRSDSVSLLHDAELI
jgi:hypothetical protein